VAPAINANQPPDKNRGNPNNQADGTFTYQHQNTDARPTNHKPKEQPAIRAENEGCRDKTTVLIKPEHT
jgi:hypothetical protein